MGLASIMVRLGLDATGYQTGLKRAESMTSRFSGAVKSKLAGVFAVGALTAYTRSVVQFAGGISDMANRTKLSAEVLQEWNYAAEQTGTSLQSIVRAYEYLQRVNPGKTSAELLKNFYDLAELVRKGEISNEASYVNKLLGRGATEVIPAFREGFVQFANDARQLGIVMDNDVIAKLDEFGDKMVELKARLRGPAGIGIATLGTWIADAVNAGVTSVDYAARYLGARTVVGSEQARKLAFDETFGAQAKAEMARFVTTVTGQAKPAQLMGQEESVTERATTSKWSTSNLTANQQIGAFSAGQPLLITELKEQTRTLKKIEQNTKEIEENG